MEEEEVTEVVEDRDSVRGPLGIKKARGLLLSLRAV